MVVRVVKMTFRPEECDRFLELFDGWRHRIRAFPGCRYLELLGEQGNSGVFMTYSEWDDPSDLENYRLSAVFAEVWPTVKGMFAAPAEAWTADRLHRMP
ncbi:MAG: antibiotic biosynthesis monooxygenase family protein [Flavobacteriales bacterium]